MPNNEGSAGAGRDGSRLWSVVLKIRKLRAQELEMKRFTRYQADQLMLLADELEALAVPDPLASDTGQGEYETCVRSIAETHRAIGYGYRGTAPEVAKEWNWKADALFAAADALKAAPLASSSAPQGESTKDETTKT